METTRLITEREDLIPLNEYHALIKIGFLAISALISDAMKEL